MAQALELLNIPLEGTHHRGGMMLGILLEFWQN
jgi:hypothetical protein